MLLCKENFLWWGPKFCTLLLSTGNKLTLSWFQSLSKINFNFSDVLKMQDYTVKLVRAVRKHMTLSQFSNWRTWRSPATEC